MYCRLYDGDCSDFDDRLADHTPATIKSNRMTAALCRKSSLDIAHDMDAMASCSKVFTSAINAELSLRGMDLQPINRIPITTTLTTVFRTVISP
jgi:hypothetical protein